MRRLPIFLVVDVSESMVGHNLRYMQQSIGELISRLRQDPYALESVYISVIAFAGAAGTIVPLTELMAFYTPRLPIGSGTSIGAALNVVMNEMDKHIKPTTSTTKGDWKPLVYFMSDGSSTDDPAPAVMRWKKHFSHRAKLINIGIGSFADLSTLAEISELGFRLEDEDLPNAYRMLSECLSDSILSQSRSLGIDSKLTLSEQHLQNTAVSLIKDPAQAVAVDENYAIISGICQKIKLPYLIKYQRLNTTLDVDLFQYEGVYVVEKDYEYWSDNRVNHHKISTAQLVGVGGCPHCGASCALASCDCGQIFCVDNDGEAVCPGCHQTLYMSSEGGDFDIARSRG